MSIREKTLEKAKAAVCKDRQETYGPIEDSFKEIGGLWSAYLDIKLSNNQVAMMMVLLKVARSKHKISYMDNYVDIAGYAACASEMASCEKVDHDVDYKSDITQKPFPGYRPGSISTLSEEIKRSRS